jgi:predicted membrane protein
VEDGNNENRDHSGHFFGGVVLIVLGVLFLLDTLHLVPGIEDVFRFWPILLIILGIRKLQEQHRTGCRPRSGLFWIVLGAFLLASETHIFRVNIWNLFWPAMLIWLGIRTLQRKTRRPRISSSDGSSTIFLTSVMSGIRRQYNSQEFKGGKIEVVMGGCELDLRGANMASGEAILDVSVVMGGIDLRIPDDWTVVCRVTPILAGIDDRTYSPKEGTKRLVLEGSLIMGGVDIKN